MINSGLFVGYRVGELIVGWDISILFIESRVSRLIVDISRAMVLSSICIMNQGEL